jgi:hypothetical protein
MVVVVSVVQLAAATFWNAAAHWDWDVREWVADTRGATIAWWSVQAIVAVYLTSGVTKILHSRAEWISRSPGLLVAAAARLDTAASMGSAFQLASARRAEHAIRVLFAHAGAARLLFAAGLLVELTAPLGLLGENALLVVGLALLALHQANLRLLSLPCHSYQILVITYLVNVPRLWA